MSEQSEFFETHIHADRVVAEFDFSTWEGQHSPVLIIRSEYGTVVLNPMDLGTYLDLDVHAFTPDGGRAKVGVMVMDRGRTFGLVKHEASSTVTGWPAASLVALFLGEQVDTGRPPTVMTYGFGGFECCEDGEWVVTSVHGTVKHDRILACTAHRDQAASNASNYVSGWGDVNVTVARRAKRG